MRICFNWRMRKSISMSKNSLFPWFKVMMEIFCTLGVLMPKNFVRVTAGCRCGLKGIEEIAEMGFYDEELD
jgi:hypothetical protein